MVSNRTSHRCHYVGINSLKVGENMTGLIMTFGLGIFILIGAMIVFLTKNNAKFIDFSLSLALGVILMIMLTDLIPESYEIFTMKNIIWLILFVVLGFFLLYILDRFIPNHEDDPTTNKDDHNHLVHIGLVSSIALVLHNIIEGMAIYSTVLSSFSLGMMVSIGVGLHNIPLGMVIASSIYQHNQKKGKTLWLVLLLSLSTFLGGIILFLLGGNAINEFLLGILLAITLGMLCYISFCELLPHVLHSKYQKQSRLGIVCGIGLMMITVLLKQ